MGDVRIGTSGWAYKDWNGPFYPDEVKARDRLAYISGRFPTLEINASFYRMPTDKAVASWRDQTPADFLFAWKASRYITHNKKLKDCQDSVDLVFGRMAPLGDTQGPALVQLPPQLRRNDERLETFIGWLPKGVRAAFEFRHPSWYEQAVFDLLARHDCAFVISDHHSAPAPSVVTAGWVYWRGHGPGGRYRGSYSDEALAALARDIEGWGRRGLDVFAYFDNDIKSAAPHDALRLKGLLGH